MKLIGVIMVECEEEEFRKDVYGIGDITAARIVEKLDDEFAVVVSFPLVIE